MGISVRKRCSDIRSYCNYPIVCNDSLSYGSDQVLQDSVAINKRSLFEALCVNSSISANYISINLIQNILAGNFNYSQKTNFSEMFRFDHYWRHYASIRVFQQNIFQLIWCMCQNILPGIFKCKKTNFLELFRSDAVILIGAWIANQDYQSFAKKYLRFT
jgi:hypothetical protein